MPINPTIDAQWARGINSLVEPSLLHEGEYQWGINIDNAGGIIQTRQGMNVIGSQTIRLPAKEPKGMAVFKDKNGDATIIIAIGSELWGCAYPFKDDFHKLAEGFYADKPVTFCRTFKSFKLNHDGSVAGVETYPVLIAQNGVERAKWLDGSTWRTSDPTATPHPGIPIGHWMQWSGGRLWVAAGAKLHASDFGNPISFSEETNFVAGGGALFFEDVITGMNQTPNLQSLLVCTDFNTSVVNSNITDRTQWGQTPGFQSVLLPGIGCAAGKSFVRQWGIVWWMSHGGWIGLDQAINTYRSSRIVYRDQEMLRSKSNLSDDISKITSGSFGNTLLVAVPDGDSYNARIWTLNQRPVDTALSNDPSAWSSVWSGIRPVEFTTVTLGGQQRIFALSKDDGDEEQAFFPNVWELFTGERQDRFGDNVFLPNCTFETRLLAFSQDLKRFRYAELDIAELKGLAHIEVFVASRRGGYHNILSKDLVASQGSVNSPITSQFITTLTADAHVGDTTLHVATTSGALPTLFMPAINIQGVVLRYNSKSATTFTVVSPLKQNLPSGTQVIQPQFGYPDGPPLTSYLPQRRMLRTSEWNVKDAERYSAPVESTLSDNIDRGFSIMVKWTGRLAITGLRIFTDQWDDQTMGRCEDEEATSRLLDTYGAGGLSATLNEPRTIDTARLTSKYLHVVTPRPLDTEYKPLINLPPQFPTGTIIALQSKPDGQYVTTPEAGSHIGGWGDVDPWSLWTSASSIGAFEKFIVTNLGGGVIALKALANNKFVTALPQINNWVLRAIADTIAAPEKFMVVNLGQYVALKTVNGYYVQSYTGFPLTANSGETEIREDNQFKVITL